MIFIILGSQKFQFNRLVKEVDKLIENGYITEEVYAQIGYSDYEPKNFKFKRFMDRDEFNQIENAASIIITHGGTGAIIGAIKKNKRVIAVPRLVRYGEHVDNHQIQLIEQFKNQNLICGLNSCEELGNAIKNIMDVSFKSYNSNTERYLKSIEQFIEGEFL